MKTVIEMLREARALIADPGAWTKGCLARDAAESRVVVDDPRACKWCASGAINRATGNSPDLFIDAARAYRAALSLAADGCIPDFNDAPTTTHADVIAAFDRAIAAEEAK